MVLAALGIVYGDIGTSPLYTLKETFLASHMQVGETGILGFVSLIIWALILVVTLKYVVFILHADNKGEGGVVVLMQLALQYLRGKPAWVVLMMGLAGTAMLLPFTFDMDPYTAFAFLLGLGSTTATGDPIPAILFGVPGGAASAATVLDGYPMAKRGEAGR